MTIINSIPITTYKPRIKTSETIEMTIPRSKATVNIHPGTIKSALILMFMAIARATVEMTNYECYQALILKRQNIIMKQSLNWCVIPTNLYLASINNIQNTNILFWYLDPKAVLYILTIKYMRSISRMIWTSLMLCLFMLKSVILLKKL